MSPPPPQGGAQKAVYSRETEQLREENSSLRAEVEDWKNRLTQAEVGDWAIYNRVELIQALHLNSCPLDHLFTYRPFALLQTHSTT